MILAGALIAREACRAFGLAEVRCSEADILEGAALALAEGSLHARLRAALGRAAAAPSCPGRRPASYTPPVPEWRNW